MTAQAAILEERIKQLELEDICPMMRMRLKLTLSANCWMIEPRKHSGSKMKPLKPEKHSLGG